MSLTTTTPNETLSDEIISTNSIYAPDTLTALTPSQNIYSLCLPSYTSITLRIEFPANYPDAPPTILGTQSVGDDVQKGVGNQVVEIARGVLGTVYSPGEPCIFILLEELSEALEAIQLEQQQQHQHSSESNTANAIAALSLDDDDDDPSAESSTQSQIAASARRHAAAGSAGPEPPWTTGEPITEKKSVFVGRVATVSSPAQAKSYLAHLLATDKKAAKATHNITAWRIRGANDTSYQDCDDDGETAAGGRLLHLMQLMDVWDVMVVVTRWYGGVHLGPDRFRIINAAARGALVLGGFVKGAKEGGATEGKKKGKR